MWLLLTWLVVGLFVIEWLVVVLFVVVDLLVVDSMVGCCPVCY